MYWLRSLSPAHKAEREKECPVPCADQLYSRPVPGVRAQDFPITGQDGTRVADLRGIATQEFTIIFTAQKTQILAVGTGGGGQVEDPGKSGGFPALDTPPPGRAPVPVSPESKYAVHRIDLSNGRLNVIAVPFPFLVTCFLA